LVAGFLLLDLFGLWASIRLIGAAYLLLTLLALPSSRRLRGVLVATVVTTLLVLTTTLPYGTYENVYIDREMGEELLDLTEGSHGTVAVVRRGDDLRLKLDNSYLLGTSASAPNLRLQSWIPMSLHPAPKKVFYLGMGTGITAGAALDLPIESVTVTELNPDVIDSARVYFSSFLNGLFEDPRVDIRQEDGRNLLFASPNTYDVVIADIFLTHPAGTGSLYTREHFETIRSRLDAGGLFAQWLPMFELSEEEFGIIARTMLDVFPQVTLWSRGFSPKYPVMALVGQTGGTPLDQDTFIRNVDELSRRSALPEDTWFLNIPLAAYAGNLTVISNAYSDYPVSTDDRVPLEYLAPIIERDRHATGGEWELAWRRLAELREGILRRSPPDSDPYLERLDTHQLRQIEAGLRFYSSETYRRTGDSDLAEAELERYRRLLARPENQN
jgi:spermidine synthase